MVCTFISVLFIGQVVLLLLFRCHETFDELPEVDVVIILFLGVVIKLVFQFVVRCVNDAILVLIEVDDCEFVIVRLCLRVVPVLLDHL